MFIPPPGYLDGGGEEMITRENLRVSVLMGVLSLSFCAALIVQKS